MAGFDNNVLWADNVDFRGIDPPTAQVTADGQLLIGSASGTAIRAALLTSSDSSVTFTTGAGTLSLQVAGGTSVGKTITGDSGGALSPTSGNWNILGNSSQGVSSSGSGSSLTFTVADASTSQKGVLELSDNAETQLLFDGKL